VKVISRKKHFPFVIGTGAVKSPNSNAQVETQIAKSPRAAEVAKKNKTNFSTLSLVLSTLCFVQKLGCPASAQIHQRTKFKERSSKLVFNLGGFSSSNRFISQAVLFPQWQMRQGIALVFSSPEHRKAAQLRRL